MHDAMVEAIRASNLGGLAQDLIPDLFIVSEPEAAAQYVIASLGSEERLRQGEVFIILDAGGGTVDITTYKVTSNELGPLRLQGEVIAPDGALCGSSLIKERYLRKIRAKVGEIDKDGDPKLLDGAAIALANQWDMFQKPKIDVADRKTYFARFGSTKRYKGHPVNWTEDEIREVFEDSLKGTTDLLERQIQLAKEKNLIVNKLIVVGGFGDSPSLKFRIRQTLLKCCSSSGEEIDVIWPKDFPTSAVARGAVLRALDKRNGPDRISRSSFGFLRHEQYEDFEEHKEANVVPERDEVDQDNLVRDTIHWLIQAVSNCGYPDVMLAFD
jgi:molecular chaperone DnaK (HSP70)